MSRPRSMLRRIPASYLVSGLVLLALFSTFSVLDENFLSPNNLANILRQSSVLIIIAMPMTLVIMTEGIDISVGAVLSLSTVIFAMVLLATGSLPVALLAAVGIGILFGSLGGLLVAYLSMPPFIATLGILGLAQSTALLATDGISITGIPTSISAIYWQSWNGIPLPIVMAAAAVVVTFFLLHHTRFGGYIVALGGNRSALRLAGVNSRFVLFCVYVFNGAVVGLTALLVTARMNAGHPTGALGIEFDAIAAIAIGGTSFERGEGRLLGTLVGAITIGVMRNGLNLLAFSASFQLVCLGALVIVALTADQLQKRARLA